MVRSLLTPLGVAVLSLGLLTLVDAAPITIVSNSVNSFRNTRGVNDVGVASGERNQFGADLIPASGSTFTGVQGAFSTGPRVCAPLAVDANFCATSVPFSPSQVGS